MQYSDVVTFFHEFGHLMHAILGGQQSWAGVSGIATEGDFVEVPSQMLEEFFHDAKLLPRSPATTRRRAHSPSSGGTPDRASAFGRADGVRTQLFYTSYSLDVPPTGARRSGSRCLLEEGYRAHDALRVDRRQSMYASFTHLIGYSSNYSTYMFASDCAGFLRPVRPILICSREPTADALPADHSRTLVDRSRARELIEALLGPRTEDGRLCRVGGRGISPAVAAPGREAWHRLFCVGPVQGANGRCLTGASAGIGEAIAAELAEAGVNLVLHARRQRSGLTLLAERARTLTFHFNAGIAPPTLPLSASAAADL